MVEIAHLRDRLPARVQVAALAERHQLFHHRAQVLGLRQRGRDLLVLDQRLRTCWRTSPCDAPSVRLNLRWVLP
jgi:hypothetical protein